MADVWDCEQCGTSFEPRREHARFCSARCRAAWNREHTGDPAAGASALVWSITAMSEATDRLPRVRAWNRPRAFAVISEAVWWVTIVDATLVRHHPDAARRNEHDSRRPGPGDAQDLRDPRQATGLQRGHRRGTSPVETEHMRALVALAVAPQRVQAAPPKPRTGSALRWCSPRNNLQELARRRMSAPRACLAPGMAPTGCSTVRISLLNREVFTFGFDLRGCGSVSVPPTG
jgi:hypothetical protein